MGQITTHVLDTALGLPGQGVAVTLSQRHHDTWKIMAQGLTNTDGRVPDLLPDAQVLAAGMYCMRFELEAYLQATSQPVFYPFAEVVFNIDGNGDHYHIPLLLSPFGYSTYRGS